MCKELLVIPVKKVVDPKRIIGIKWRSLPPKRSDGGWKIESHMYVSNAYVLTQARKKTTADIGKLENCNLKL
jgi:hypothetical protein